ncbi:MAG: hypothetical protein NVS9B5_12040 [Terriglobales bacterium]
MAHMTVRASAVLGKALSLSEQERRLLIDRRIASRDDGPADEGVEQAWGDEIKVRVDDVRSGKVKRFRATRCDAVWRRAC